MVEAKKIGRSLVGTLVGDLISGLISWVGIRDGWNVLFNDDWRQEIWDLQEKGIFVVEFHGGFGWLSGSSCYFGTWKKPSWTGLATHFFVGFTGIKGVAIWVFCFWFFKRHNTWRNHMESPYLRLVNSLEWYVPSDIYRSIPVARINGELSTRNG